MGKRLDITPDIEAAIDRSTDNSVDPNSVAVFETVALNTLPINKRGTIFHGAIASENLLHQMAKFVTAPGGFVPLHNNHDQGYALPVGRVFDAQTRENEFGITELRTLFYLPLSEEALIQKIETGTVEEVSVGVQAKHLNCSECGFDYMGPEAEFENFFDATCANGHKIGEEGVHVNMVGLDRFMELSIVSVGAANKAKIQTRAKALLGKEQYHERLAATGVVPEATILFAAPTIEKESSMDLTTLVADLISAKASLQVNEAALKKAEETIATLKTEAEGLKARLTDLETTADPKVPEMQAELEATRGSLTEAVQLLRVEADRLSVASSLEKPAEAATLSDLAGFIGSARTKLATMIPVGGVALQANVGTGKQQPTRANSSFKTK